MTTAHKPTYHPAVGSANPGGFRYYAPKAAYSARDVASHTKLKVRQVGQNAPEELQARDLKKELQENEARHFDQVLSDKRRAGMLPYSSDTVSTTSSSSSSASSTKLLASSSSRPEEEEASAPTVDLSQFDDADDEGVASDDGRHGGRKKEKADSDEEKSDQEDDEDDEAELLRELERIKKEREEEKKRKELEQAEKEAKEKTDAVLRGNPLLNANFKVKRRWDDDVVFKNQARDEPQKLQKRFINDTIRSDFHRNFLRKYCQ